MKEYYVYVLRCSDGSYYTGVTNNVEQRLAQHGDGVDPMSYTYTRRPVTLVHVESFRDVNDAIAREKQIKPWSRKKKEALIRENFDELHEAAKKRNWKKF